MRIQLASLVLVAACAQQKVAVDDDFSSLDGVDQKSDSFSYRMKVVGTLTYGATSSSTKYTSSPRYRAFKFVGQKGDDVDVWVRSTDGGDAVAWVLDDKFKTLGHNDDADTNTVDAHIELKLPASTTSTHYIVFRDYSTSTAHFKVELGGGPAYDISCAADNDCVAVFAGGCCPDGRKFAVNKDSTDEYAAATACTEPPHVCPLHVILENRVAQCDFGTNQCAMVQPEDIRCGGFTTHPHSCAPGYVCHYDMVPDVPGHCIPDTQP